MTFRSYLSYKAGPVSLGLYGLILEIYSVAVTLTATGISLAVTRLVSENLLTGKNNIRKIVNTCVVISLSLSLITGCAMFFFAPSIGKYILNDCRTVLSLKILSVSLPFLAVSACLRGYFFATHKILSCASEQVLEQILEMTVFVMLSDALIPKGPEFACAAIVTGTTIAESVSVLYASVIYLRDVKKYNGRPAKNFAKRIFNIYLPTTASHFISSGLSTVENTLVPLGLQQYGFSRELSLKNYGIITGMVGPLISFPSSLLFSISTLLIPEISQSNILGKKQDIKKISIKTIRLTLLFSVLAASTFALFGEHISLLIYKNDCCGTYLKIFAPLVPLIYLDTIIEGILKGMNDQVKLLSFSIINSTVKVILTVVLLPIFGIPGQIIVTFAGAILSISLISLRLVKLINYCGVKK